MRNSFVFAASSFALAATVSLQAQTFPQGRWYPAYDWGDPVPITGRGRINLIHVGLIPTGPHKGKVVFVTWDYPQYPAGVGGAGAWWGILDPDLQQPGMPPPMQAFVHAAGAPPGITNFGEATCVGQSWTPDGRWLLAGGQAGSNGGVIANQWERYDGSRGAWLYDPDVVGLGAPSGPPNHYEFGQWFQQPDMLNRRYYPTVMLTQIDLPNPPNGGEMIVAGGSDDFWLPLIQNPPLPQPQALYSDDYETFRPGPRGWGSPPPAQGTWQTIPTGSRLFPGPLGTGRQLRWYPRLFLLPDGRMVNIGTEPQTTIAVHPVITGAAWANLDARSLAGSRGYGTAVLFPNFTATHANTVVNIAGAGPNPALPTGFGAVTNVEWANAAATGTGIWPTGPDWTTTPDPTALPDLAKARQECNAVTLPTGAVLVLGDGSPVRYRTPELLDGGVWADMMDEASDRDHHAVALLLRSGKVLSASGNNRQFDFQVFEPPYLSMGPRPAWNVVPGNGTLVRGQNYSVAITLPPGTSIGKVVLMRPGSLTHHADMDQRYVEMPLLPPDDDATTTVKFRAPDGPPIFPPVAGQVTAPLGHYMAFLVTDTGVPSVAEFVRFQ